jgi:hypothetical protein
MKAEVDNNKGVDLSPLEVPYGKESPEAAVGQHSSTMSVRETHEEPEPEKPNWNVLCAIVILLIMVAFGAGLGIGVGIDGPV